MFYYIFFSAIQNINNILKNNSEIKILKSDKPNSFWEGKKYVFDQPFRFKNAL